jgi:DNA-binding NarL/FixJ family response regulator
MAGQTGVVIVEDSEQSLRRLVSAVEEIPGLSLVGSAATPSDAIELASTLRPEILILDLYLLGGSGVEVLEAIREQEIDTQVVVVTNEPSPALNEACLNLGARFFFDKSLEWEQLQKALRNLRAEAAGNNGRSNLLGTGNW